MNTATNTPKLAGKGRRRRESSRHDQGLTAKEKATFMWICKWFSERETKACRKTKQ